MSTTAYLPTIYLSGEDAGSIKSEVQQQLDNIESAFETLSNLETSELVRGIITSDSAIAGDKTYLVDPSAGALTLSLPKVNASENNSRILVINHTSSTNTITVQPAGGDSFNGASTIAAANTSAYLVASSQLSGWVRVY